MVIDVTRIRGKRVQKAGKLMSDDEIRRFLDTARKIEPEHYAFFATLLLSGMRLGEVRALQWRDIRFDEQLISVTKSLRKGEVTPPKTAAANCRAEIPPELVTILKEYRLKRGRAGDIEMVFGSQLSYWFRKAFHRILKAAGIENRRIHDLRHSFAANCLRLGCSLHWLKTQLGHSSISVTSDTYGHLVPSNDRTYINNLGSILQPNCNRAGAI